jgi:hypothetical protein
MQRPVRLAKPKFASCYLMHQGMKRPTFAAASSSLTLRRLSYGAVTVTVGPRRQSRKFVVAISDLRRFSTYFNAILPAHATRPVRIKFQEYRPDSFETFLRFIGSGKIYSQIDDEDSGDAEDNEWHRLQRAWELGESLDSVPFKDAIVDAFYEKVLVESCFPQDMHLSIFDTSPEHVGLKELLVDVAARDWKPSDIENTEFNSSFLTRFIFTYMTIKEASDDD